MPELIATPTQIWLVVTPVDLRRGIDGLSSIVEQTLGHSPCAGSAFIFRNRIGHRIKLLLWDGNGVWLCQRRLHQGRFVWPKTGESCFSMSSAQWQWLQQAWTGNDYRQNRRRIGRYKTSNIIHQKPCIKGAFGGLLRYNTRHETA